jgi:repressor LexA
MSIVPRHQSNNRGPVTLGVHAGLTKAQARVMVFLRRYFKESGGVSPSYQEIIDGVGYKSKSRAHEVLRDLRERGHIGFLENRARSIWLIERREAAGWE